MRNTENNQERPQNLKRKLTSALAMLLISTILLTTTSYAWFVLSTAPEVTGIETQVGANGSLEIALLNTETRTDMSLIRAGLGGSSLAANDQSANNAWGNLVDLGYTNYGLGEILLLPARLDAIVEGEGHRINPGILAVPSYGFDGRIVELSRNALSAIYQEQDFMYSSGIQDYGVRAIGTSNAMTPQGAALAMAKSNIKAYRDNAQAGAVNVLRNDGSNLFDIVMVYQAQGTYDDTHKEALDTMLINLGAVLDYVDLSLREGLVAYAASQIGDEALFANVRNQIMNTSIELSTMLGSLSGIGAIPAEFEEWVEKLDVMQNDLNAAKNACNMLTGGSYTWAQIKPILTMIMDVDNVYVEGKTINELDLNDLADKVMNDGTVEMTLAPGSGLFADVADFAENYTAIVEYKLNMAGLPAIKVDIEMATASTAKPAHLTALVEEVSALKPASGGESAAVLPLTATYGYAIDLAFRCNAAEPDLVLQTKGVQRVYSGSEESDVPQSDAGSTQGGGSYMEFTAAADDLSLEQRLALMDAIRVGFMDDKNTLLGIAKLNITSREVEDGKIRAPLYMYNYELIEDEHGMMLTMGERKLTDNLITDLEQNVAKALTVMVWLDGDIVDNTMVSATQAASLDGVLNLQFATSAELIPAVDGALLEYPADKSGLEGIVAEAEEIYTKGQGTYTNVSWNAFMAAYERADAVNNNDNAGVIEIRNAVAGLTEAKNLLIGVSHEAIDNKIAEIRDKVGTVDETARHVVNDGENGYTALGNEEHTQDEHDSWTIVGEINRVDYNKNMIDEGNGVYTTIYSDESWNALAGALYEAEAVVMNPDATEDQINAALTALENAEKALSRQIFFTPYEYKGDLYYLAICESTNEDIYYKWYDSSFKRVQSEVAILNLNAYAEPTTIVEMGQDIYIPSDTDYITPDIAFLEEVFPELRDVELVGVQWNKVDSDLLTEMMLPRHYNKLMELINIAKTDEVLQMIRVSKEENVVQPGETLWVVSDKQPDSATATGTAWHQVRDENGVPVSKYVCDKTEHTHSLEDCYYHCPGAHTHGVSCFDEVDKDKLVCGKEEHTCDKCEEQEGKLICTAEEHTHVAACKQYLWIVETGGPAYFDNALKEAQLLTTKWELELTQDRKTEVTAATAEKTIADLNDAIVQLYEENTEILEKEGVDMTSNQRILLTAAVNAAISVEECDNMEALKAATATAEAILNGDGVAKRKEATEALTKLNEELKKAGQTAVTEGNTLLHKLPEGMTSGDIVYNVDYPGITLKLTGKDGRTTLSANVLTADGVVVEVSREIRIYDRPDGAMIRLGDKEIEGKTATIDEKFELKANLFWNDENGEKQFDEALSDEVIKKVTWASSDPNVLTITGREDFLVEATAKAIGTVNVSVSVETLHNVFVVEIPVVVYGVQEPLGIRLAKIEGNNETRVDQLEFDELTTETTTEDGETVTQPVTVVLKPSLEYDTAATNYIPEAIASCKLTSSNREVVTVDAQEDGNFVLTVVKPGAAELKVQYTTISGKVYENSYPVYVQCDYITDVAFNIGGLSDEDVLEKDAVATVAVPTISYADTGDDEKEQVKSYTGRSSDDAVVTVKRNDDGTFTITTAGYGEADVTITVTTEGGNEFSKTFHIVVPAPEPEPTEPSETPTETPTEATTEPNA